MRTLTIILSLAALSLSGCASKQEKLVGAWDCSTIHPGGFVSSDIFEFDQNGLLKLHSGEVQMRGSYTLNGDTLTMRLLDVPVPGDSPKVVTQQQTLTATIGELGRTKLLMNVTTGNDIHKSTCRKH
jgi:hypothetical protein